MGAACCGSDKFEDRKQKAKTKQKPKISNDQNSNADRDISDLRNRRDSDEEGEVPSRQPPVHPRSGGPVSNIDNKKGNKYATTEAFSPTENQSPTPINIHSTDTMNTSRQKDDGIVDNDHLRARRTSSLKSNVIAGTSATSEHFARATRGGEGGQKQHDSSDVSISNITSTQQPEPMATILPSPQLFTNGVQNSSANDNNSSRGGGTTTGSASTFGTRQNLNLFAEDGGTNTFHRLAAPGDSAHPNNKDGVKKPLNIGDVSGDIVLTFDDDDDVPSPNTARVAEQQLDLFNAGYTTEESPTRETEAISSTGDNRLANLLNQNKQHNHDHPTEKGQEPSKESPTRVVNGAISMQSWSSSKPPQEAEEADQVLSNALNKNADVHDERSSSAAPSSAQPPIQRIQNTVPILPEDNVNYNTQHLSEHERGESGHVTTASSLQQLSLPFSKQPAGTSITSGSDKLPVPPKDSMENSLRSNEEYISDNNNNMSSALPKPQKNAFGNKPPSATTNAIGNHPIKLASLNSGGLEMPIFKKGDEEKVLSKEWFRSQHVDPPRVTWSQTKTTIKIEIEPANESCGWNFDDKSGKVIEYNYDDGNFRIRAILPLWEAVKNPDFELKITVNGGGDEEQNKGAGAMKNCQTVLVFTADKLPAPRGKDSDSDEDSDDDDNQMKKGDQHRPPRFWTQLFDCSRKTYIGLDWVHNADEENNSANGKPSEVYQYQGLARPGAEEQYASYNYGNGGGGGGDFSDADD